MPIPEYADLVGDLLRSQAQWSPTLNSITGLDEDRRLQLLGVVVDRGDLQRSVRAATRRAVPRATLVGIPPAIDWRSVGGKNYVTAVKDQGSCGSCVSFCSCGCLESMLLIKRDTTADLSEADLHFCGAHGANCGGWWPADAMNELQSRGVPDESYFPYASAFDAAGNPSCSTRTDRNQRAYKITGSTVLATMAQRKAWLAANGPVCAVIHVYDDFYTYHSGVYSHVSGNHAGYHCIEIVGYSDVENCWIAKNSWGPGWGDHGFFKIAYGQCGIDETSTDTDPGGATNQFPMWGINDVVMPPAPPNWSGYQDLGGLILSGPTVASWAANRLDMFLRGADNAMWHVWWDGTAFRGWESLGGVIDGAPTAVSWGPNRIDCFYRGIDNHLYHRWFDGIWHGAQDLGGLITSSPTVASWGVNRLDVFAKGADNAMWHLWWDGTAFRGWESLGGVLEDAPAAVSWGPNRIDCFTRGTDSHLYHRWFDGTWHDAQDLGGLITSSPSVSSWGVNRLDVFARGVDNAMLHLAFDGTGWSSWENLGGVIDDAPAAVSWGPNRIDCFARGMNNHLWHKWFS
jgi:C1A family cysteine protease